MMLKSSTWAIIKKQLTALRLQLRVPCIVARVTAELPAVFSYMWSAIEVLRCVPTV